MNGKERDMRIAMYDDDRIGVVTPDDTVVELNDLLGQFNPLGPEDLLPDLITHFDEVKGEIESRAAAGGGKPLSRARCALFPNCVRQRLWPSRSGRSHRPARSSSGSTPGDANAAGRSS